MNELWPSKQPLFHASPHVFERPDYQMIERNIRNHDNGLLGCWWSASPDWIRSFGQYIYTLYADPGTCYRAISVASLREMGEASPCSRAYFRQYRDALLMQGVDVLCVQEDDGRIDMGIIINFNCIASVHRSPA